MTVDDLQAGDRQLAADLRLSLERLYEVVGSGWQVVARGEHDLPTAAEPRWYIAGEPPQVMLGVSWHEPGQVLVARPNGVWRSWMLTFEPHMPAALNVEDVAGLKSRLAEVATSRRRSFRWCRYCRTLAAPELRTEADVCSGCASVAQGVAF